MTLVEDKKLEIDIPQACDEVVVLSGGGGDGPPGGDPGGSDGGGGDGVPRGSREWPLIPAVIVTCLLAAALTSMGILVQVWAASRLPAP